jgi:uncharacterized membrane protein
MTDITNLSVLALFASITYACRIAGFIMMRHVPFTPAVRHGLEALPGSVMAAVIVPGVMTAGLPGLIGVSGALLTMYLTKRDIAAMVIGCAAVAFARAVGL